jgi:protein ImuA
MHLSDPFPAPNTLDLQGRVLEDLRQQVGQIETARRGWGEPLLPTGLAALDRRLPGGGLRGGSLVELLSAGEGDGAETLAFRFAREACRQGGALVVLDAARRFYPPGCVELGIDLDRLIVVQAETESPRDDAWALDQALRCPAVAAAVAWPGWLDGRVFRRLQLAAEQGGGLGLLIRPSRFAHEPSWADVRLLVTPLPGDGCGTRRLAVHVLSHRAAETPRVEIEL